jgi:hypothetical protein
VKSGGPKETGTLEVLQEGHVVGLGGKIPNGQIIGKGLASDHIDVSHLVFNRGGKVGGIFAIGEIKARSHLDIGVQGDAGIDDLNDPFDSHAVVRR